MKDDETSWIWELNPHDIWYEDKVRYFRNHINKSRHRFLVLKASLEDYGVELILKKDVVETKTAERSGETTTREIP